MPKNNNEYNVKRFYEMLERAKGERSLRQYALDAGVSPAHLYRLKKGEYVPSAKMINLLTSEKAAPRGNVTKEDLMKAIGYQDEKSSFQLYDEYIDYKSEEDREKRRDFEKRVLAYSTAIEGIILKELLGRSISIKTIDLKEQVDGSELIYKPDIALSIEKQKIKEWFFEIKYFKTEGIANCKRMVNMIMGELTLIKPKQDRKISIVVNNKDLYNYFVQYKDSMSYLGELSIILIDENSLSIVGETYLSHFNYNDKSLELKLA